MTFIVNKNKLKIQVNCCSQFKYKRKLTTLEINSLKFSDDVNDLQSKVKLNF